MSIKYMKLPIYSIAVNGDCIYFSGGGGGSTGIPNEIKIYHRAITPQPAASIPAGNHIMENLTVCQQRQIVVGNANADIVVFQALEGGRSLQEKYRFQADFALKNATINAICFSSSGDVICVGGDDTNIRFYRLGADGAELVHSYSCHSQTIKNVDHNQGQLYLSTDNQRIVVCNLPKKQIVRTLFQDQLQPEKSKFQSAYFIQPGSSELLITHFIIKQATYVSKEAKGKVTTVEVAEDQCCQTAYHREQKVLGIGCGSGTTLMVDASDLSSLGREKAHDYIITGCTIAPRTRRFLTGTSVCSYHIQSPEGELQLGWRWLVNLLVVVAIIFLLGSYRSLPNEEL